ncbi:anthranilate synthase component II [Pseudoscardovia suis]|uniref:anthranilate synthase component II n=1 Tax=Pseudoscardovia suis TaxID=987063 RepID=UPI003F969623
MDSARILVIDNYDSFVYTIVGYLQTLGATTKVVRNDTVDPRHLDVRVFNGVLISPGPGQPSQAGASEDVIRLCAETNTPMFGVCLGLQALAEVYGATIVHAPTIRHGKTSPIEHEDDEIFAGVPNPMTATRYHSLCIDPESLPDTLHATAHATDDGTIQAVRVVGKPMYAVQFHPESVMTEGGYRLLANWLASCGQTNAVAKSAGLRPNVSATLREQPAVA